MSTPKSSQTNPDVKSQRMVAIFAERRFQRTRANQRLRLALSWWVIRTKLMSSLKRVLDVTVAIIAIILTAPIMLITAILIKLESPGPVIFKQVRVGKDGEHFYCYKFRSMYVDAEQRLRELQAKNEADGPVFKMKRDPRVTRVGRVIRKLSIDELPSSSTY